MRGFCDRSLRAGPRPGLAAWVLILAATLCSASFPAFASASADSIATLSAPFPPPAVSLGQPFQREIRWGPMAGYDFEDGRVLTRLYTRAGWTDLIPSWTWLQAGLEGSLGSSGTDARATVGAYAGLPWLQAGLDLQLPSQHPIFGLQLHVPLRRAGLMRRGDLLRVDYRPELRELMVGLSLGEPFRSYHATRPLATGIALPTGSTPRLALPAPSPEIARSLESIRASILGMDELLTPHFAFGDEFDASAQRYRDRIREPGHGFAQEDSTYHRALSAAFAAALDGDAAAGDGLAREAERVILEDVLLPFDRAFGQEKKPSHAGGLCRRAAATFDMRLLESPGLLGLSVATLEARRETARMIFARVLRDIEDASAQAFRRWRGKFLGWDNRACLVWLPLNYGLRPEQYDTQEEWDAILGRLTGQPFEDANTIEYLMLEQFHLELKRQIRATERYQVTVVHDFRGQTEEGRTDIYGWDMVADGYIAAFTQAIRALDRGERTSLPQFFLFLDAHYYRLRGGRSLASFLEHLDRPDALQLENEVIEDQVRAAHEELLAAIRNSPALARLDADTRANLLKVNVSITNPFDPAFGMDVFRRDHRKFAFRDVFEEDPASGEAIFTGQGIGEHYNGTAWEDRSLRVRGPALLQLKSATRELFLQQGFADADVPSFLAERPRPADYAARCARLEQAGWTVPVSIVMNATGYGPKHANVLKATMYNLAPRASFLLCYDSLWISEFWAGMFVGAALRGVHVLPVGATPANSPSDGAPTLCFVRENLDLVFRAQQFFAEDLARTHGLLRVGLYDQIIPVDDFGRRVREFLAGLDANPFLGDVIPVHAVARDSLRSFAGEYQEVPFVALSLKPKPSLHLKNQFFATWEAFQVFRLAEWGPVVRRHLGIRQRQVERRTTEAIRPELLRTTDGGVREARTLLEAFDRHLDTISPDARSRVIYTFTTGSQNQNPRSLLLDGEELVATSGRGSLVTGIDFVFILGITDWPTTREEFDRRVPAPHPAAPAATAARDHARPELSAPSCGSSAVLRGMIGRSLRQAGSGIQRQADPREEPAPIKVPPRVSATNTPADLCVAVACSHLQLEGRGDGDIALAKDVDPHSRALPFISLRAFPRDLELAGSIRHVETKACPEAEPSLALGGWEVAHGRRERIRRRIECDGPGEVLDAGAGREAFVVQREASIVRSVETNTEAVCRTAVDLVNLERAATLAQDVVQRFDNVVHVSHRVARIPAVAGEAPERLAAGEGWQQDQRGHERRRAGDACQTADSRGGVRDDLLSRLHVGLRFAGLQRQRVAQRRVAPQQVGRDRGAAQQARGEQAPRRDHALQRHADAEQHAEQVERERDHQDGGDVPEVRSALRQVGQPRGDDAVGEEDEQVHAVERQHRAGGDREQVDVAEAVEQDAAEHGSGPEDRVSGLEVEHREERGDDGVAKDPGDHSLAQDLDTFGFHQAPPSFRAPAARGRGPDRDGTADARSRLMLGACHTRTSGPRHG